MTDDAEPATLSAQTAANNRRLRQQIDIRDRGRLNEVAEAVFDTHARRSVEEVLAALIAHSHACGYKPTVETLNNAAYAISRGHRYASP